MQQIFPARKTPRYKHNREWGQYQQQLTDAVVVGVHVVLVPMLVCIFPDALQSLIPPPPVEFLLTPIQPHMLSTLVTHALRSHLNKLKDYFLNLHSSILSPVVVVVFVICFNINLSTRRLNTQKECSLPPNTRSVTMAISLSSCRSFQSHKMATQSNRICATSSAKERSNKGINSQYGQYLASIWPRKVFGGKGKGA